MRRPRRRRRPSLPPRRRPQRQRSRTGARRQRSCRRRTCPTYAVTPSRGIESQAGIWSSCWSSGDRNTCADGRPPWAAPTVSRCEPAKARRRPGADHRRPSVGNAACPTRRAGRARRHTLLHGPCRGRGRRRCRRSGGSGYSRRRWRLGGRHLRGGRGRRRLLGDWRNRRSNGQRHGRPDLLLNGHRPVLVLAASYRCRNEDQDHGGAGGAGGPLRPARPASHTPVVPIPLPARGALTCALVRHGRSPPLSPI
jgi:hypothetical protein